MRKACCVLVSLLGCGAPALPAARLPTPCAAPAWSSSGAAAPTSNTAPLLELHLRPLPTDAGGSVAVTVVLTAPEAELSSLRLPAGLRQPLEIHVTRMRSSCDPATGVPRVEHSVLRGEPGTPLSLGATSARGRVRVQLDYQLDVGAPSAHPFHLDAQRFLAEGRQLFVLPAALANAQVPALIAIDPSGYGGDGRAVSSLGIGAERRAPMSVHAIEEAVFAAGYLGSAVFQAPEGQDETAWFGSPMFDPRPLAAEIASFRSAVRERLRDTSDTPLTMLLSVDSAVISFDVRRTPASVLLRVAPGQVLSAQLRLSILHQVLKEWIGGRLFLVDASGGEAVWFTEGLCRYLARELAFEFGLITPVEYAEELNGLIAIQSVLGAERHAAACAAEALLPAGAFSACRNLLALARGALLAGELDGTLRAHHKSLTELLANWLRNGPTLLPAGAFATELAQDAGQPATLLLSAFARGAAIVPASAAFGPCFASSPLRSSEAALGFEYRWAAASAPQAPTPAHWLVTHVPEASPAFAAGLREGNALSAIDFAPYDAQRPVRVLLPTGQQIEYRPQTQPVSSVAWKRVPGVPDPRCLRP